MSYRNAIRHTLYQVNTHHHTTEQRVTRTAKVVLADDDGFDNAEDDAKSTNDDEQYPDDIRLPMTVRVNHRSRDVRLTDIHWLNYSRLGNDSLLLLWLHCDRSTHGHTTKVLAYDSTSYVDILGALTNVLINKAPCTLPLFEGYAHEVPHLSLCFCSPPLVS